MHCNVWGAKPNRIYNIQNPIVIKHLNKLRIGFSHLKEDKFRHNVQDSVDLMCNCNAGVEPTIYFFLHFASFHLERQTFLDIIRNHSQTFLIENDDTIANNLLLGEESSSNNVNKVILNLTFEYSFSSKRFNFLLF